MSVTLTVNENSYDYPELSDRGWGPDASDWAQAVTNGMLQKQVGTLGTTQTFTLAGDVDFGATYGLKTAYYKSRGTNVSSTGVVRLANAELVAWRNNANGGDLGVRVNSSDWLQFNNVDLVTISASQTLTNKTLTTPTINGALGGTLTLPAGTALLPSLIGTSSTTGMYFDASGSVDFSSATTRSFTIDGTGVAVQSGIARFPSGAAATPTVVGASFSTTGLYFAAGPTIGFSVGAASVGTITSSGLTMPWVGQASATAIAAGKVGEEIKSEITSSANFPTSTEFGDLTSISLTTGLWLVSLHGQFVDNAATTTSASFGIGLVSGNSSSGLSGAINMGSVDDATSLKNTTIPVANYYMRLASTTTVYMKYSATYSVGTPKGRGTIRAVRIA